MFPSTKLVRRKKMVRMLIKIHIGSPAFRTWRAKSFYAIVSKKVSVVKFQTVLIYSYFLNERFNIAVIFKKVGAKVDNHHKITQKVP